jgi:hypothetical protein
MSMKCKSHTSDSLYVNNYRKLIFLLALISFAFSGCGWHVSKSMNKNNEKSISIPYVEGDSDGLLTASIIEQVEQQGGYKYVRDGGQLLLKVKVIDKESENIGFRYDPKHFAEKVKRVIPNEGRLKKLVEVSVLQGSTQECILGPIYIMGTCDFDHENYSPDRNINIFSLGQLSDIDTTYEVVDVPLNRDIGKKIALFLDNNFDNLCSQ